LPPPTISSTAGRNLFSTAYLNLIRDLRIQALDRGLRNGDFGKMVSDAYETIRVQEERIRSGRSGT
jgi:hypothetical protein